MKGASEMESNEYDGFFYAMLILGIVGIIGFVLVAGAGL
jgi:hypothetical protein